MKKLYQLAVDTTGDAGDATGEETTDTTVYALLSNIKIDYNASAPATTDVTISEDGGLGRTLLTISNNNTDGVYNPGEKFHDSTGTQLTIPRLPLLVDVKLKVAVGGCDELTNAVIVTFALIPLDD